MSFSSNQPLSSNQLPLSLEMPSLKEEDIFIEELEILLKRISAAVNTKDGALYDLQEVANFQQFFVPSATLTVTGNPFDFRSGYRKVFEIGAIASGGTSAVNHNISGAVVYTRIYGTVITDVVDYRPIPYASVTAANQQIEVKVTATQYVIINGAAAPGITSGILVLEYLKN